jgi:hypothetical protein
VRAKESRERRSDVYANYLTTAGLYWAEVWALAQTLAAGEDATRRPGKDRPSKAKHWGASQRDCSQRRTVIGQLQIGDRSGARLARPSSRAPVVG